MGTITFVSPVHYQQVVADRKALMIAIDEIKELMKPSKRSSLQTFICIRKVISDEKLPRLEKAPVF